MNKKQYSDLGRIIKEIGPKAAIEAFYQEIDKTINRTKGKRQERYQGIKNTIQEIDEEGIEIILETSLADLSKKYNSNPRAVRDAVSTFYHKICEAADKEIVKKSKNLKENRIRLPKYNYIRL